MKAVSKYIQLRTLSEGGSKRIQSMHTRTGASFAVLITNSVHAGRIVDYRTYLQNQIDSLSSGASQGFVCYLQLLKESGGRSSEPLTPDTSKMDLDREFAILNAPPQGNLFTNLVMRA